MKKQKPPLTVTADEFKRLAREQWSEAEFQEQVIKIAQGLGWKVAHFRKGLTKGGGWITPVGADGKGFFDLVLVRGRIMFVELKVGTNKPTTEQLAWHAAVKATDGEVYLWRPEHWDEIMEKLR